VNSPTTRSLLRWVEGVYLIEKGVSDGIALLRFLAHFGGGSVRSRAVRARGGISCETSARPHSPNRSKQKNRQNFYENLWRTSAESNPITRRMGGAHHGDAPAHRDDQRRDLRGSNPVYDSYVERWKPKPSKRCKLMREIFQNASFREASKPTKSLGLCCCCATSLAVPCSQIPERFQEVEPHLGPPRAGGKPHRKHGGSRLRARARTRYRQQQEAIRELSTPVCRFRERLLILPIIGVIDPQRARQLTEQLLRGSRTTTKSYDSISPVWQPWTSRWQTTWCNGRGLAASWRGRVIVTGLSPEMPRRVTIGVDLRAR